MIKKRMPNGKLCETDFGCSQRVDRCIKFAVNIEQGARCGKGRGRI